MSVDKNQLSINVGDMVEVKKCRMGDTHHEGRTGKITDIHADSMSQWPVCPRDIYVVHLDNGDVCEAMEIDRVIIFEKVEVNPKSKDYPKVEQQCRLCALLGTDDHEQQFGNDHMSYGCNKTCIPGGEWKGFVPYVAVKVEDLNGTKLIDGHHYKIVGTTKKTECNNVCIGKVATYCAEKDQLLAKHLCWDNHDDSCGSVSSKGLLILEDMDPEPRKVGAAGNVAPVKGEYCPESLGKDMRCWQLGEAVRHIKDVVARAEKAEQRASAYQSDMTTMAANFDAAKGKFCTCCGTPYDSSETLPKPHVPKWAKNEQTPCKSCVHAHRWFWTDGGFCVCVMITPENGGECHKYEPRYTRAQRRAMTLAGKLKAAIADAEASRARTKQHRDAFDKILAEKDAAITKAEQKGLEAVANTAQLDNKIIAEKSAEIVRLLGVISTMKKTSVPLANAIPVIIEHERMEDDKHVSMAGTTHHFYLHIDVRLPENMIVNPCDLVLYKKAKEGEKFTAEQYIKHAEGD